MAKCLIFLMVAPFLALGPSLAAEQWRGLVVAPENRCSPYHAEDYRYPQSAELEIAKRMGGIWSPYTGQKFGTLKQTHIEHIVASSEAHDSGLCSADPKTRGRFAEDLANLTFASPYVRHVKRAKDAAGWLPKKGKLHT